ncbi:MAG: phage tail tape measure protein, partial [Eubacterium sp.]|nr:phage tail tape measure protein [Eubacterium sp.]
SKLVGTSKSSSSEIIKSQQSVADNFSKVTGQMTNVWNNLKMVIGYAGVAGMLRSALNEMKSMSDELITYQKVTGASSEQVAKVRSSAYQSASRYGQTPSDFLASVATMARAGYGEQSEAMADLATKTQLVGDMTSEAASKFLIAVDAGYQLKGNIEELSSVLDKANIIDNNYATSLSKVADAMTLIAPLSASMNVSIEETMAAIGTMSAVTQREGTEVARAYRMIALNIAKDTETEVEEGVKLTAEEIESLNDILQVYAANELKAADAAGKLLSPMKAIEAISKAWKSGALNEQELFGVLNGIGGARYTNSIMALVKNFDMYEDMLNKFVTEVGSADAEVEAMTQGWTAKFNQLKVAWTEMVNNAISEDFIRQLLDIAKGFVQWTGNLQTFVGVVGGATVSLKLLKSIITGTSTAFTGFGLAISAVITAVSALNAVSERQKEAAKQQATSAAESAEKAYEQAKRVKELSEAYEDLAKDGMIDSRELSEAESIQKEINTLVGELPEKYDLVSGSIEKNVEALRKMSEEERNLAIIKAKESVNTAGNALTKFGKNVVGDFTGLNITNTGVGNWSGVDEFFANALEGTSYSYRRTTSRSLGGVYYQGGSSPQEIIAAYNELEQIIDAATAQGLNEKSAAAYSALIETRDKWTAFIKAYLSADEHLSWLLTGNYSDEDKVIQKSTDDRMKGQVQSWDRLAHSIENATKAKEAFDEANKTTKADQINDYASVYATLAEELKNGRVNSTATHAALQMLLGDEAYAATGG